MDEPQLVDTAAGLAAVTAGVDLAAAVALDTEFVREKTYYPELCLIQVTTPSLTAGIDCLAGLDMRLFLDALLAPGRAWVLHSARQDLEVTWNISRRLPARLIDTQIAGALTGMAPQTSLQKLLEDTLGVSIAKDQTRAQWNRRPLPRVALEYALNDVRYLLDAWRVLEARLVAADRLSWFDEECARVLATNPEPTTAAVLERTKGVSGLSQDEQRVALALVEWREALARRRDRPRRWILADDALIQLARARPQSRRELEAIRGLPAGLVQRRAAELLEAIGHAPSLTLPATLADAAAQQRPDKGRLKAIQSALKRRADELGIAVELLATRRDAVAIESGQLPDYLRTGWRADVLADVL